MKQDHGLLHWVSVVHTQVILFLGSHWQIVPALLHLVTCLFIWWLFALRLFWYLIWKKKKVTHVQGCWLLQLIYMILWWQYPNHNLNFLRSGLRASWWAMGSWSKILPQWIIGFLTDWLKGLTSHLKGLNVPSKSELRWGSITTSRTSIVRTNKFHCLFGAQLTWSKCKVQCCGCIKAK